MAATATIASSTTASATATVTAAALGEVEDEGLLASLFRDRFPEAQWRERPDVGRYLRELSGSGLERLRREPERLAEERAQLLQQTRDLAFANYKTFIRGAECTERIHRLFGDVEASLGRLLDRLPSFQQSCRNFVKEAEEISSNRRMNTLTLNRHTEILEILEIPQLMDTCVRNSYYEEALELAAYVHRLERKYSSIPVIQGIVNEVRQSMQLMLSQLIQQLRTNIQLPACLRVISFLRCMDVFTEAELRVKFLQARDAWLRSILTAIPNDDPYFHITKTIEACRVHLFDIITQYRAIFSDEDPLLPPATGEHTMNESAIFYGWVLQRISQFLQVLETDLHRGIGGRLDSLLGQCMYFGLSFSRVGVDFRGQLAPVFQRVAISTFQKAIQEAVEKFQDEMNSYTLISAPPILGSSNLPAAVPVTQPGTLQPPMVLLDFPPLACFLNNILVAFNDLRLCCPVALAQGVTRALEDALAKVGDPALRAVAAPVDPAQLAGPELQMLVQRLVQVMRRRRCVGLSAPQLGVPLQVLALEFPEAFFRACAPPLREARQMEPFPLRVFVNPRLRVLDSRLVTFPEGCESVAGFLACVPRFQAVQISGLDPKGEQVVWQASGWAARIIQHEMDHLQGCLFIDKMDSKTFTNIYWMEVND
ncbi:hypothetical protein GH733_012986 [Mirounga leonina]|nr:hypothetical protein GH733_012986 [Mirounga leonina]